MSVNPGQKRSFSGYTKSTQQRMTMLNITNPLQNSLNKSLISNNKARLTATPDVVNSKFISGSNIRSSINVNDSSKKTPIQTIKPKSPQIFKKITNLKPVNNNVIV